MTTEKKTGSHTLYGCSVGRTIRWMSEQGISLPAIQSVLKDNKVEMSEGDITAHIAALKDGTKKAGNVSRKDRDAIAAIINKHGHKMPASLVEQPKEEPEADKPSKKEGAPRKNVQSRPKAKPAKKPAPSRTAAAASTTA